MNNSITLNNWHTIELKEMMNTFHAHFPTAQQMPNIQLVKELQSLKQASLTLIENRTESTVYQIIESGTVYQVFASGTFDEFESYEEYTKAQPIDKLQ